MSEDEQIEGENGEYCECCGAWIAWAEDEPSEPWNPEIAPLIDLPLSPEYLERMKQMTAKE